MAWRPAERQYCSAAWLVGSRDKRRRSYLVGCLKAFLKSRMQRTFYDLGKARRVVDQRSR